MQTTHDYRKEAADAVVRKSLAALERIQNAQTLTAINARELGDSEPAAHADEPLIVETQRAIEMARAALDELADSDHKE